MAESNLENSGGKSVPNPGGSGVTNTGENVTYYTVNGTRVSYIAKLQEKIYPGFRVTLLLSVAIYFAMLVIGCLHIKNCPVEPYIPLFLMVTGAIGLISKSITFARRNVAQHIPTTQIETALYTVEMVFFVLGCYWVFKEYPPSYIQNTPNYCQKTAYLFAFIYLTVFLAIGGAMIAGVICFLVCVALLSSNEDRETVDVEAQEPRRTDAPLVSS